MIVYKILATFNIVFITALVAIFIVTLFKHPGEFSAERRNILVGTGVLFIGLNIIATILTYIGILIYNIWH